VTITATSTQVDVILALREAINVINGLPDTAFKNKKRRKPLANKINAVIKKVNQGLFQDALNKLQHDILRKTDGCIEFGAPQGNDWITSCDAQAQVAVQLLIAIALLSAIAVDCTPTRLKLPIRMAVLLTRRLKVILPRKSGHPDRSRKAPKG